MKGKTFLPLLCIVGLVMGIALYAGGTFEDKTKEDALVLKIALEDERVKDWLERYPNYNIDEIRPQEWKSCHYEEGKEVCSSTTYPGVWITLDPDAAPKEVLLVRVKNNKEVADITHFP